jgi:hypothetical protein
MESAIKKITTNTRVIKNLLTKYTDTFRALKELINNSLQANSRNIEITIDYTDEIQYKSGIKKITIEDDGYGVAYSDFDKKILEIGTTAKERGQGIGRFGSLQIGELMHIETVAFDEAKKELSKTNFSIDTTDFQDIQLEQTAFKVDYEYLGEQKINPYYKVVIEELYHNKLPKPAKRNLITEKFVERNICQSIFENYPFEIFHNKILFKVNGKKLDRSDFVIGNPSTKTVEYTDKKGNVHDVNFYFYNIKSQLNKVKVFLQIDNAGIKSVAHEFTYSSDWYTADLGTWFIYVDSLFFDSDLFRNIDMESLGEEENRNIKIFIKDITNEFFKAKNKRFEKFIVELENDKYYPYKEDKPASSSQEIVFKKLAYLLEDEHKLISKNDKIRDFVYPLVDKAISNGDIEYIFRKVLKLSDENLEKFHYLLEKTDLEDVVHFTSLVSEKLEFLDFLHELTYGEIAKYLRKEASYIKF